MADQQNQQGLPEIDPNLEGSNLEKDPDEWTTGDEPMTGAQESYLKTLSDQAGVERDANLTKAEASKRIDELQARAGRGSRNGREGPPRVGAPYPPGCGTACCGPGEAARLLDG